jgi:uncharacterized membrane protein
MLARARLARLNPLFARFADDRRGAVAIMVGGSMLMLVGAAGFAVDFGSFFLARRHVQNAVDLAAIAAARDLPRARAAADAAMRDNGIAAPESMAVVLGHYSSDPAIPVAQRFKADATPLNAARVTATNKAEVYFGKALGLGDSVLVGAVGTAANSEFASFGVGSRLASLNGGIANAVLSGLTGSSIALNVADYRALVDARVELLGFTKALATEARLTAATYDDVLASSVKMRDVIDALIDTSSPTTGTQAALNASLNALKGGVGSTVSVPLSAALDLGEYGGLALGEGPGTGVKAQLMDVISAAAVASNGTRQLALDLGLAIPGLANLKVWLAIGQPPSESGWVTVGGTGAAVRTAQARAKISTTIAVAGITGLASVHLPLVVEAASGEASLSDVDCTTPTAPKASVMAKSGVFEAWIGDVDLDDLDDLTRVLAPERMTLANVLLLVKVTGYAHAKMGSLAPSELKFSAADISAITKKTVRSADFTTSLTGSLLSDLELEVKLLGLGLGLGPTTNAITSAVAAALTTVTPAVDGLVSSLLGTLGIGLGEADVWVSGARCDGAVLAQ